MRAGPSPCFCSARSLASRSKPRDETAVSSTRRMCMGSMSIWHWILVLGVVLLLFGGRGKISELMGDFAQGIKSFKKGMTEEDKAETEPAKSEPVKTIDHQAPQPSKPAATTQTSEKRF